MRAPRTVKLIGSILLLLGFVFGALLAEELLFHDNPMTTMSQVSLCAIGILVVGLGGALVLLGGKY